MQIKSISVQNFRCHDEKQIEVNNKTTAIIGNNGAGKTSLIEAVYIALRGSSFKGSDNDIVKKDSPWYRIDVLLDDDTKRTVTFDPAKTSGKKQFNIHDKKSYRLSPKDKYPVVLFEPEDLRLLNGSPSRRRQFIDNFIAQTDPVYSTTLRKYERALKQRNNLLKRDYAREEDFFAWDISISEYGYEIVNKRRQYIDIINEKLNKYYKNISNTKDEIVIQYSDDSIKSPQNLMRILELTFNKDKAIGFTSAGPHRHDVIFKFNNSPAIGTASRGEVRSILLALKKIEIDAIKEITSKNPIVLLDDVFSELDETRQSKLAEFVSENQVILTSTGVVGKLIDVSDVVVLRI